MRKWNKKVIERMKELYDSFTYEEIAEILNKEFKLKKTPNAVRKAYERYLIEPKDFHKKEKGPKVLILDIETLPMEAYIWSIRQDGIPLSMVKEDWSVLSFAYKWLGEEKVYYYDVQGQKDLRNDKKILKKIWKALDECDIVVGQNSDMFDLKKLNTRFLKHGMQPPSSYRKMDTYKIAKRHFSHTSNKLEYLTTEHNTKYTKLSHGNYPGFELWKQCLRRNKKAFVELKEYNIYDVKSTEELFLKLAPWDDKINWTVYYEKDTCQCGSTSFKKNGFYYTNASKFQKYRCTNCGSEYRDKKNLLKDKKKRKPVR